VVHQVLSGVGPTLTFLVKFFKKEKGNWYWRNNASCPAESRPAKNKSNPLGNVLQQWQKNMCLLILPTTNVSATLMLKSCD
jgi:hypothetical protein